MRLYRANSFYFLHLDVGIKKTHQRKDVIIVKKRNLIFGLEEPTLSVDETINEFLRFKEMSGVSPYTIESMTGTLRRYTNQYSSSFGSFKEQQESVLQYLKNKKSAYFNKELDTLRQFWEFYYKSIGEERNPCKGISFRPHPTRIVEVDFELVKKFLKIPNQKSFAGLRDYAFMILMLDTGIRPQEALRLKISDIGLDEKRIYIREEYSKTKQLRYLPISNQSILLLRKLIFARHPQWNKNGEVFCTFSGTSLNPSHLQDRFRTYSKKLGYSITPYQLRHIFALGFIKNGGDPFSLQRMMGHSRLEQTRTYVNIAKVDLINNHMKSTPLHTFLGEDKRVVKINRGAYA